MSDDVVMIVDSDDEPLSRKPSRKKQRLADPDPDVVIYDPNPEAESEQIRGYFMAKGAPGAGAGRLGGGGSGPGQGSLNGAPVGGGMGGGEGALGDASHLGEEERATVRKAPRDKDKPALESEEEEEEQDLIITAQSGTFSAVLPTP